MLTENNIKGAFKETGLYPCDKGVLSLHQMDEKENSRDVTRNICSQTTTAGNQHPSKVPSPQSGPCSYPVQEKENVNPSIVRTEGNFIRCLISTS